MKKLAPIFLLLSLLLIAPLLISCEKPDEPDTQPDPVPTDYTVTVVDFNGVPLSDVIVTFYNSETGEEVAMKLVKPSTGTATVNLPGGNYKFTLTPPGTDSFYYDESKCVFTATETAVTVSVYGIPTEYEEHFYVDNYTGTPFKAHGAGTYYAPVKAGEMTYFVFTATEIGTFKIRCISELSLTVGNYGIPHFVQQNDISEPDNDPAAFELIVRTSNLGSSSKPATPIVIGIKATDTSAQGNAILIIERTGDPPYSIIDEPWHTVQAESKYLVQTPSNDYLNRPVGFVPLNISSQTLPIVYNESDGYYHYLTENGPTVMVKISQPSEYLAAFTEICDNTNFGAILYDGDGNFIRKETYNELIAAYAAICDKNGACPLNPQLEYVIKSVGNYYGNWWNTSNNIFGSTAFFPETAWLFACGYYQPSQALGTSDSPLELKLATGTASILLSEGETLYFTVTTSAGLKITVSDPDSKLTVTCNETPYTAESGVITVEFAQSGSFTLSGITEGELAISLTVASLQS